MDRAVLETMMRDIAEGASKALNRSCFSGQATAGRRGPGYALQQASLKRRQAPTLLLTTLSTPLLMDALLPEERQRYVEDPALGAFFVLLAGPWHQA